jgi:hypothetical protein
MTKDNKKLIAKLTAIAVLIGGATYETTQAKKDLTVGYSTEKVLETFKDDTKLDEAIENNIGEYDNMSIIESAEKLKTGMAIINLLRNFDFSEVEDLEKLSSAEYKFADTLKWEDVVILTQIATTENDSLEAQESKLKAIKMLDHINETQKEFVENNGENIILNTLSWTIKSSIAEELNVNTKNINDIEIPPFKKITDMNFYVTYNDERYNILNSKADIADAFYYYYQLQLPYNVEEEEKFELYKDALNASKIAIMTGVTEQNNTFKNTRSIKEAKKILKRS